MSAVAFRPRGVNRLRCLLRRLGWGGAAIALLGAVSFGGLTLYLLPHWRINPDLSHGFFSPLLSVLLLRRAVSAGPPRCFPAGGIGLALQIGWIAAGLTALALGGLYAVSLGWSHVLVAFLLTGGAVSLGLAALAHFSSPGQRLIPFNGTAAAALLVWMLAAPLPPGTASRLTFGLQELVVRWVLQTLQWLGIPASQHGNVIRLADSIVGVEEACSGIRSLISCVFAGVFFAAYLVRRPASRVLLVASSAFLAIGMNYLRSLTLTLLANAGVGIEGAWHDLTGFAVLAVTALLLAALALLLEHVEGPSEAAPRSTPAPRLHLSGARWREGLLLGAFGLAAVLALFFVINTRPRDGSPPAPLELATVLPDAFPGWTTRPLENLYQFSQALQTEHLVQRTYLKEGLGIPIQLTVYLAYWPPGQASVSQVSSHTPDACWPGTGWELDVPSKQRITLAGPSQPPPAEYRLFRKVGLPQHVWFWHVYEGRVIHPGDPRSPSELLRLALRYGFQREAEQVFVRISSNRDWTELAAEPLVRELLERLASLGLDKSSNIASD